MKIDLKGFHAFITGGSSGFGFEMAKTLLNCGATVAIAARGGGKLDNALAALKEVSADVCALGMDVRDEGSVIEAAGWIKANWPRLDMLVNNAGIGNVGINKGTREDPTPFFEVDTDAFMNIVQTNFIGYFHVAKAVVPLMIPGGGGRVITVSTSIRTMSAPGQLPYGPARAGAEAMSVIMSDELKKYDITVNVLLPGGASATGLGGGNASSNFAPGTLLPATILNDPILFLASDKAKGMTNERIIGKEFREWLNEKGIDWTLTDDNA
jgi:gluconate 5-dehydrogenase